MKDIIAAEIDKCFAILQKGGIILYPTDTIWGIGCDATNATAIDRIYKLKQRNENKKMVVLLDSKEMLYRYVNIVPMAALQIIDTAIKPTTIIYDGGQNLAKNLVTTDNSIAIRIVKSLFCQLLIKKLDKPLVSTSANISNQPSPSNFSEISDAVLQGVDYVVNLQQEERHNAVPSSIIKLDVNGNITIIR